MPYEAKKQKCKKEDGSSGTHTIYKKGTSEKVGCTSDPSGYMAKLYSVEESTNKDKQMKISRKKLKEIIKEHLEEGMFDWVPPLSAKKRKPEKKWSAEGEWSEALTAISDKVMPALWGRFDNPPHPELLKKGQDLMAGMKAVGPKPSINENLAEINTLDDLARLFAVRSQGGTVARFDPAEAKAAIAILSGMSEGT